MRTFKFLSHPFKPKSTFQPEKIVFQADLNFVRKIEETFFMLELLYRKKFSFHIKRFRGFKCQNETLNCSIF